MADPNPYQPPHMPDPLSTTKVVKRAIGFGVILLLTPIAVAVTIAIACSTTTLLPEIKTSPWDAVLRYGYVLMLPFAVLSAMVAWAARIHIHNTRAGKRAGRVAILLFTPIAVVVATAVGFGLTYLYVEAPGPRQFDTAAMIVGFLLFISPPSLALIGMLLWAWNHEA
jgi:hypothetical protein